MTDRKCWNRWLFAWITSIWAIKIDFRTIILDALICQLVSKFYFQFWSTRYFETTISSGKSVKIGKNGKVSLKCDGICCSWRCSVFGKIGNVRRLDIWWYLMIFGVFEKRWYLGHWFDRDFAIYWNTIGHLIFVLLVIYFGLLSKFDTLSVDDFKLEHWDVNIFSGLVYTYLW